MSFSGKVKEELSRQISTARHCQIAEIAAILSVCGQVSISANDHFCVTVHTENVSVARKYFTLVEKTFNIDGLGLLGFKAIVQVDFPIVLGLLVISVLILLIGNLISDLIYVSVDPRIKLD